MCFHSGIIYNGVMMLGKIVTGDCLPTYEALQNMSARLAERFPCLKKGSIGESWTGRDIISLSFGCMDEPVLFAAAFHGQEWLTSLVLLRFCEDLFSAMEAGQEICEVNSRRAFLGRGLIFIPCMNPDGVEIALNGWDTAGVYADFVQGVCGGDLTDWNANARGVDLNHNYNAGWRILRKMEMEAGIHGPAPRRYGGTKPESELETQALVKLCRRIPIRHAFALHSQGEEIYWDYSDRTPSKSRFMAQVLAISSGYTLAQPETIASHGGFKDWFIEEFSRPAFTIELGKGKNPLPLTDLEPVYQKAKEMFVVGAIL